MQRKSLTSINGTIIQITLSPFEAMVLCAMAAKANIPTIASVVKCGDDGVGRVVRDFYLLLRES